MTARNNLLPHRYSYAVTNGFDQDVDFPVYIDTVISEGTEDDLEDGLDYNVKDKEEEFYPWIRADRDDTKPSHVQMTPHFSVDNTLSDLGSAQSWWVFVWQQLCQEVSTLSPAQQDLIKKTNDDLFLQYGQEITLLRQRLLATRISHREMESNYLNQLQDASDQLQKAHLKINTLMYSKHDNETRNLSAAGTSEVDFSDLFEQEKKKNTILHEELQALQ